MWVVDIVPKVILGHKMSKTVEFCYSTLDKNYKNDNFVTPHLTKTTKMTILSSVSVDFWGFVWYNN